MHSSEVVRRNRWWLVLVLTSAFLLGCKDATEPEAKPMPIAAIVVAPKDGVWTGTLKVGQSMTLEAKAKAADGSVLPVAEFSWTSSNPAIASVSAQGAVQAHQQGTVEISASANGKQGGTTLTVIVDPSAQVAYVLISPSGVVLPVGQTRQFIARAFDADSNEILGRPVTWSTDAPLHVSVNASGLVKALQHGYATIIASIDGKVAGVAVTVPEPAGGSTAAVLVTPGNTSVFTTSRLQLRARAVDLDGTTLPNRYMAWSSENPNIATVDANGVVQGIAKGRARIRAIADGVIGYASVDVRNLPTGTQQLYSLAGTETLPSQYIDIGPTIWRDAEGRPHDARLVVRGGTLKFDLQAGTYERSFVVNTYLAEADRLLVGTRVVSDQGKLYYDFETGAPLLVTAAGATQRAELRGAGEYSITHSVLGQPGQKWVWIIE